MDTTTRNLLTHRARIFLLLLSIAFACLLSACAAVPGYRKALHDISWPERYARLSDLQSWHSRGSLAIKHGHDITLGSFRWQQAGTHYDLQISGPMGIGSLRVTGHPGSAILWQSANDQLIADSPEALMRAELGWSLPLVHLRYWVLGLPAPGIAFQATFDGLHHIVALDQQGWALHFSHFAVFVGPDGVTELDLPTKISLAHARTANSPKMRIKLHMTHWEL